MSRKLLRVQNKSTLSITCTQHKNYDALEGFFGAKETIMDRFNCSSISIYRYFAFISIFRPVLNLHDTFVSFFSFYVTFVITYLKIHLYSPHINFIRSDFQYIGSYITIPDHYIIMCLLVHQRTSILHVWYYVAIVTVHCSYLPHKSYLVRPAPLHQVPSTNLLRLTHYY